MRDLIADRPNAKPVGIGKSKSTVDMSVMDSRLSDDEDGSEFITAPPTSDNGGFDEEK